MKEFQQKRKIQNWMYSKIVIFLLIIIAIIILKGAWGVYLKKVESDKNLTKTEAEYNQLSARKNNITDSIARLNTPNGIEEEIQQKFNVVRGEENIAVIVGGGVSTTTVSPVNPPKSFWGKIWDSITGVFK